MCAGFLMCGFDTDRASRVAPQESYRNATKAQKPCECQKWHNENDESSLHNTETLSVAVRHARSDEDFVTWPSQGEKKRKQNVNGRNLRLRSLNTIESSTA